MTSNLFNKKHTWRQKEKPQQDTTQQDIYWTKEIEKTMSLVYSYEVAYAMVSKRKIQEFFEADIKINCGK